MLEPRKASEVSFPYTGVSYIRISDNNDIHFVNAPKSREDKLNLLELLKESKITGAKFIAPWVGQYRTDIFEIDDVDEAINCLTKATYK